MARYYDEDDIFHYGVKGMKWGIRRYQPYSYTGGSGKEVGLAKKLAKGSGSSDDRARRKAQKKANKAVIKQRKQDVKNRYTMSEDELNTKINRLRKENELQALTRKNLETPASKELNRIKDKYLDRIENDVVDTTYKGAKLGAKILGKKVKLPSKKYATIAGEGEKKKSKHDTYRSRSLTAIVAKSQNKKVDKSFEKWNEQTKNRETAIDIGKKMNAAKLSGDEPLYKSLKKQYKESMRDVTTYRKGQVEQSVLSDISRKYLSKAKNTKKLLDSDPTNKQLKKQYAKEMDLYEKTRAKARKSPKKYENRSKAKAHIKRSITNAAKRTANQIMYDSIFGR